jgi:hypothetical protein
MTERSNQLLSRGVLRRTPQTPRSLRGSESRFARRPLLVGEVALPAVSGT